MKRSIIISVVMALICVIPTKAQVMKAADLEKYAKQRYGEKWLDAAATIGRTLNFDPPSFPLRDGRREAW